MLYSDYVGVEGWSWETAPSPLPPTVVREWYAAPTPGLD